MLADNFELARKYWPVFEPVMDAGESLLTASAAIYVEASERYGRGAGDGTIAITDRRVIHRGDQSGVLTINRHEISSVARSWIVLPGSRQVTIHCRDNGIPRTHNFYCGKDFSKDIVRLLS
jgi:hypothetical protein